MHTRYKILVIDDVPANIEILLDLLGESYDILAAIDGETGIELAIEEKPDLILLDIIMPNRDGYEICQILKANPITENIPIIFITAKLDEKSLEKAYDVGGIDYVTKPFKPKELLARVKTQTELQRLMRNLEYTSSYDAMTDIFNRQKFFERAERVFLEQPQHLYAMIIDIDRCKEINDSYGQHIGDKAIQLVASVIKSKTNPSDIYGRVGGEEFAILGTYTNTEQALVDIDNIRSSIEAQVLLADNGDEIPLTISQGVAKNRNSIQSLEQLIKVADVALYQAKNKGRNRTIYKV